MDDQAKRYQVKNALKMIKRDHKQSLLRVIGSGAYFLLLEVGMIGQRFLSDSRKIEELSLYDSQDRVNEGQWELVQYLTQLTIGLWILLVGLSVFGYFFFGTGIRRQLLVNQEEIQIKGLLGSSSSHISREFYLEQVLPVGVGGLLGLIIGLIVSYCGRLILILVYHASWPTVWYYPFIISSLLIIITCVTLLNQYRKIKKRINKINN